MRKGFTLMEVAIFACIILIFIGMLAPAIAMVSKGTGQTINGVHVKYSDVIGKTFEWNGNTIFVTNYKNGVYTVVVNGDVKVEADKKSVFEAYKKHLNNNVEIDNN